MRKIAFVVAVSVAFLLLGSCASMKPYEAKQVGQPVESGGKVALAKSVFVEFVSLFPLIDAGVYNGKFKDIKDDVAASDKTAVESEETALLSILGSVSGGTVVRAPFTLDEDTKQSIISSGISDDLVASLSASATKIASENSVNQVVFVIHLKTLNYGNSWGRGIVGIRTNVLVFSKEGVKIAEGVARASKSEVPSDKPNDHKAVLPMVFGQVNTLVPLLYGKTEEKN